MPRSTGWPGSYSSQTSWNATLPRNGGAVRAPGRSLTVGVTSSTSTIRSAEAAAWAIRPVYLATSRIGLNAVFR